MPGPITSVTFAFTIAWMSSICGTATQWIIYEKSPCGSFATDCAEGNGVAELSVWWQLRMITIGALRECFCAVTANEIAYAFAHKGLKAIVMAMFSLMHALSAALAQSFTPLMKNPCLVGVWLNPAIALLVSSILFYHQFRYMNHVSILLKEEDGIPDGIQEDEQAASGSKERATAVVESTIISSTYRKRAISV
jgi:dipeptide/tripeptide permease